MNVTDYIRPICLPSQGFVDPVDGDILELSGWGRPSDGKSHFRDSRVNQFRKKKYSKTFWVRFDWTNYSVVDGIQNSIDGSFVNFWLKQRDTSLTEKELIKLR